MDSLTRTCDICGQKKAQNERWFIGVVRPGAPGIGFGHEGSVYSDDGLVIEHICGQSCLHKRLSRWTEQSEQKEVAA
jgi:hypothetical protein